MAKTYKGHFDISHMIETAMKEHICFVIACSSDSQRGAGKTYSSAKWLYEHAIKGERFMVFVRNVKDLGRIAEGIFGNYVADHHPDVTIQERKQDNVFSYVFANSGTGDDKKSELLGFIAPLKNAPTCKQYRGIFQSSNVKFFYMDEFMPMDNRYLPDEPRLMKTLYDTVNGNIEDLPIIMTSNTITLGSPYMSMLKLNGKLQTGTRRLKTDTVIYENVTVEGLSEKHMNSAANRAFGQADENYLNNLWIGDENSLVEKPNNWGRAIYVCTLVYNDRRFGVTAYYGSQYVYVSNTVDKHCEYIYNVCTDGNRNIPLIRTAPFLKQLRENFFKGNVRVSNGDIQRILIEIFG